MEEEGREVRGQRRRKERRGERRRRRKIKRNVRKNVRRDSFNAVVCPVLNIAGLGTEKTHLSKEPCMTLRVRTTPPTTVCRYSKGTLEDKRKKTVIAE